MAAMPMRAAGMAGGALVEKAADKDAKGGSAAPTRVREYFPETMLWQPALITDDHGRAELPVNFADSITTWRLSASASSQAGALGGGVGSPSGVSRLLRRYRSAGRSDAERRGRIPQSPFTTT